jgi:hypothetical protein
MIGAVRPPCQPEALLVARSFRSLARRFAPVLLPICLLLAVALPVRAAAPPPVVFHLEDEGGLSVARLCERVWQQHGAALAADILPRGVVADTVLCLVLTTAQFNHHFERHLPDWGVGVALPTGRVIALDHQRVPTVGPGPETVFLHEMAHALLFQGAGEADLPTWLHEGVAMRAAGQWRFTDTLDVVLSGRLPALAGLEGPFPRGAAAAQRAYRTSLLAVNWLEREHGPRAVARVVAASRRSGDFYAGFTEATGESPDEFSRRFAGAMQLRYGWVLILFRWPTLFVLMSLLFMVGALRKIYLYRRSLRHDDDHDDDHDDHEGGGHGIGSAWRDDDEADGQRPHH